MARPHALLRAGFPYVKTIGYSQQLRLPLDVAFGKDGRLYILCHANYEHLVMGPIALLNFEDDPLPRYGKPEHRYSSSFPVEDGHVMSPVQIIADEDENLYVTDEGCHRISIYDVDGEFVVKWGDLGSDDGQLNSPSGIALDADGNVLIADTRNHRVQKFTKDGRFLMNWGSFGDGDGEFNMPWGITVDDEACVYVADWRNDRIQKFTPDGEFVWQLGKSGSRDGELDRPSGVAVDKDGDIYVCDWGNNRVQLFAPEGRFIQKFVGDATVSKARLHRMQTQNARARRLRESGSLEQEKYFDGAWSVRVDNEGYMYVTDHGRCRVQIYKKEAYPLEEKDIIEPLRAANLATNM